MQISTKNIIKAAVCATFGAVLIFGIAGCAKQAEPGESATDRIVYTATQGGQHAITTDGKSASYNFISVNKTGDESNGDNSDFYGTNAAVFATNGATLDIDDAEITSDASHANAVFSYGEGTTLNIKNSKINTSSNNSGGVMVTGGGTLNAENLNIETQGGSSAAIRSDKGGGNLNVNGGTYVSHGSGSPAIYSTANINCENATLSGTTSQAVVVEGGNSVKLVNCNTTGNSTKKNSNKSDTYQAVMIYQSMSGDASSGDSSFTMNGGTLTSQNGEMFFVTNTTTTINLDSVTFNYADDVFLRAVAAGWGSSGSNGGRATVNANNQAMQGKIIVDGDSAVNLLMTGNSTFNGTFENSGKAYVSLTQGCKWTLTADCSIDSLTCNADAIDLNGHTLTVGGSVYKAGTASTGSQIDMSQYKSSSKSGGNGGNSSSKGEGTPGSKSKGK